MPTTNPAFYPARGPTTTDLDYFIGVLSSQYWQVGQQDLSYKIEANPDRIIEIIAAPRSLGPRIGGVPDNGF